MGEGLKDEVIFRSILIVPQLVLLLLVLGPAFCFAADDAPKAELKPAARVESKYPFRTDFANAQLPWYQPKPGEFPPHHSDHRVGGELVSADFIHRTGQFRVSKTGELVDFTMPPYGSINYLNAEADLRDVPLGTFFLFFLHQDSQGGFTRLATMQDQYTMDAGHGFSYRLDELSLGEGKLLTTKQSLPKNKSLSENRLGEGDSPILLRGLRKIGTVPGGSRIGSKPDLGKKELLVSEQTRVWKGDKQGTVSDLAVGDELLFNVTGKTAQSPGICTDIWVGSDTHKLVTEQQRKKHVAFVKFRGLPGWVDKTEGNKLTVTLFSGDWHNFQESYLDNIAVGKDLAVVVANDELRTWNPPTDKEKSSLLEIQKVSVDAYGSSGVRLVCTVANMLEGFRRGRIVRVFGPGWPIKDQFYGESLMGYGYGRLQDAELVELTPKEYPAQFPFRTDYGNEHLPWYQLQPGVVPPRFSEHLVFGEVVKVDPAARTIQFRPDRSRSDHFRSDGGGELVEATLIPEAAVRYLNADAELSDLPPGTRCRFHLYQDEKGAFTRASLVSDEYSFLAGNAVTYRVESLKLGEGKLLVARQIPEVKNYNGDMERPPDIGRAELLVSAETRVWKGNQAAKLADLALGDALLVNLTGEQTGAPSRCTDIWVGTDTHKLVTEQQSKKHAPAKKK
jgi:hypothetical protein